MALKARRSSELCSIWTLEFNLVQTSVVWKVHLGIFYLGEGLEIDLAERI